MESVKNELVKAQRLTDGPQHYFYGYYDNPAWNKSEKHHLCHRVKFWDRLPTRDDVAELGLIDMDSKVYIPLAETTAWNFQQGTMLQWNPQSPDDEIIFNTRDGEGYREYLLTTSPSILTGQDLYF
jgi:hypothetical protein